MPKYSVTIQATIIKTYDIEAEDKETAITEAHEQFSCAPESRETYEQETVDVRETEPNPTETAEPEPKPKP